MKDIRKLSSSIGRLSHQEECLFTFLTHFLLTIQKLLHDLLEFLLESIGLTLQQLMTLLGSCYLLFEELQIPISSKGYILLAVI